MLCSAALDRKAFGVSTWERFGAPRAWVAVTITLGCLVYFDTGSSGEASLWANSLSAVSTLLVWDSIRITYLGGEMKFVRQSTIYGPTTSLLSLVLIHSLPEGRIFQCLQCILPWQIQC